ncbi:hypothetical protein GGR54DRAFT_110139 [Hypoxylon sp. NC1633]|nr:hypothetical protein GGR54DRAFT_110139 [Hypoxylon sp. NC1633]
MASFAALSVELRYMIWDLALHQEAYDRLILLCQPVKGKPAHVVPLKHNASPLLAVSYESRERAKAFYTARLGVYEAGPPPAPPQQPVFWEGVVHFSQLSDSLEATSKCRGAIYVSPKWDHFVTSSDLDTKLLWQCTALDRKSQTWTLGPCRYVTAGMDPKAARAIRNVVCLQMRPDTAYRWADTWYDDEDKEKYVPGISPPTPHMWRGGHVSDLWRTWTLERIQNYYQIWLTREELAEFVPNLNKNRGRGSYDIRRWVIYLNEYPRYLNWALFDFAELQRQNRDMKRVKFHLDSSWGEMIKKHSLY